MMVKFYRLFLIGLLAFILSACAETEENVVNESKNDIEAAETETNENNDHDSNNTEAVKDNNVANQPSDVQGIFQKAAEVANTVDSAYLEGENNFHKDLFGLTQSGVEKTTGEMSMSEASYHIVIESDDDTGQSTEEAYLTAEGVYATANGEWVQIPYEGVETFDGLITETQLNYFADHADDFSLDEDDQHYIISTPEDDEAHFALVKGYAEAQIGDLSEILDDVTHFSGHTAYYFDKDSFYLMEVHSKIDMTMGDGEDQMIMNDDFVYKYSKHNEIDPPVVPDEIKEKAMKFGD